MKAFTAILSLGSLLLIGTAGAQTNTQAQIKGRLVSAARSNPIVQAVLSQSARETRLRVSQCKVTTKEARGEFTSDNNPSGEVVLSFSCSNLEREHARFGEIKGNVYNGIFYVSSIVIDTAG